MRQLISLFVISMVLAAPSCKKDCPPDEKIGEMPLSQTSKAFFPYSGQPTLVFKDESGHEVRLKAVKPIQPEKTKITVYKTCSELKYDGKSSYQYFEGEALAADFLSGQPAFAISVRLSTWNLRPEQESFYDKLTLHVSGTDAIGDGELVTDVRFSGDYEEREFNITTPMTEVGTVTLNGVSFDNAYATDEMNGRIVYYNKAKGVFGFRTSGHTYHLDRIE